MASALIVVVMHVPVYSLEGQVKNFPRKIFFSPHGFATIGNRSYTWKNNFFLSSSMCWSADGVAVSYPISLIHIVHVTVIILHNEWFHGVSLLIAEITFGWCIIGIHYHVNIFCLSTELRSGHLWSLLECCPIPFLLFRIQDPVV
jgi:hypothetical protein